MFLCNKMVWEFMTGIGVLEFTVLKGTVNFYGSD
jgi:hypothetical protein